MSNKVKKQAASLPFSLSQWFKKISTMQPSSQLITVVIMGVAVLLFSGLVYNLVNQPLIAYQTSSRFYFMYPSLSEQFIFDTVVAATLYIAGLAGLLIVHRSSRSAYNPRQAYMQLTIGVALVLIAYLFIEYVIYAKMYGL
ncbi:MAG: hypothetical protein GX638_13070 [Crenarchaeota archaeon]|nr:hypothetical protein [Thermoproteota archaeon]